MRAPGREGGALSMDWRWPQEQERVKSFALEPLISISLHSRPREPGTMFADGRGNSAEPDPSAVAALVQGVLERKPFLVLTGRKGAGKTAVLDATLQIVSRSGTRIVPL